VSAFASTLIADHRIRRCTKRIGLIRCYAQQDLFARVDSRPDARCDKRHDKGVGLPVRSIGSPDRILVADDFGVAGHSVLSDHALDTRIATHSLRFQ